MALTGGCTGQLASPSRADGPIRVPWLPAQRIGSGLRPPARSPQRQSEAFEIIRYRFFGLEFSGKYTRNVFATSIGRRPSPEVDPAVEQLCSAMLARLEGCRDRQAAGDAISRMTV